jgi:glycosyltransferase involved in cell wall biosynthesis
MAKRVMQIIDRLNVGGPTKYVTWLAAGLDPAKFQNLVVTGTIPPGEGDMTWFARQAGVEPLIIPEMSRELSMKDFLVLWKLLRLMISYKPDLVHTHKAKAGAIGRLAVLLYTLLTGNSCRVVHIFHGHIFHSYYGRIKTGIFLIIEKILARLATDRILTISEQQRQEIGDTFGVGVPAQHEVIAYGLDFSAPAGPSLHSILGVSSDIPIIGLVGRLCEVKNHEMFIESARILNERNIPVIFAIIGDGHLREDLEKKVSQLDLNNMVHFTGFRDDVMNLYRDLSIAAITSLNEGTPFTLIEAMNFGIPVVATAVGGVIDLMGAKISGAQIGRVEFWQNGLTVDSRDAAAYADAVQYLIENPITRREMGGQAAGFCLAHYSRERFIRDITDLYDRLLIKSTAAS